jgi:CSLREA domain-containing protein
VVKRFRGHRVTFIDASAAALFLFAGISESIAATFLVTTTADGNHGACTVALCSLRDAVIAANATASADVITLPAGTYTLTIAETNEDAAAKGDLDVTGDLTINGAGAATTIVDGGGLDRVFDVRSGTVVFNDITIRNGSTVPDSDLGGGILISSSGTLTLNRCVVSGNSGFEGGGISNDGMLTINGSTISGNTTANFGAGIHNNVNGTLTINDGTISGNTADGDGGGISNSGALTINNSTISGNAAGRGGGIAISSTGGSVPITNSTISGNSATIGGGLFINIGATIILDTTIANNTASSGSGSGMSSEFFENTITLTNTLVANSGGNCSTSGSMMVDGGTNLQFPGTSCGTMPSVDPLLQPLANNGGPTQTHALGVGSPAIDAGTTGCPPTPATDQRGVNRPQRFACDIGAFEARALPPPTKATVIPALSEAGLAALALLVLAFAMRAVRPRRR